MKLRSSILVACMAIVPLAAMFSHKIPREWRRAIQQASRGDWTGWGTPVVGTSMPVTQAVSADPPSHAAVQETAPTPPSSRRPSEAGPAEAHVPRRSSIESQLASLGAFAVECVPMSSGLHRCSCRVRADPSGQLQRVFQASHPDPEIAFRNLLGQVHFWKHRLAASPAGGHSSIRHPSGSAGTGM